MSFSKEEYKGTSLDWHGERVGRRRFYVDIRDPGGAQDYVKTNDGVAIDGAFPGFPVCLCDLVEDEPASDGIGTIITATYSSNRRFGGTQNVDKDKPGYFSIDITYQATTQPLPVNVRKNISVKGKDGSDTKVKVWDIENHPIEEGRILLNLNVIANSWNASKTSAVNNQVNRIHTIGGKKYQFKGGRTHQRTQATTTSPATYDVTYVWWSDNGTAAITGANSFRFIFPMVAREPFEKYIVFPSDDPVGTPHDIDVYKPYKEDASGYLNLPDIKGL